MDYLKEHKKQMKELYNLMKRVPGNYAFDNDKLYKKTDERLDETDRTTFIPRFPQEKPREIVKEVIVKKKQAIPRFEEEAIMPLRRISPKIIGNIFDRVRFLEQRIIEVKNAIELREKLHEDIINSIDADIKEKEKMAMNISDLDEKRNLKLDVSLLMKEKRRESIEFWRDTYTLRSELRELLEDYQTEKKIANIFGNIEEENEKIDTKNKVNKNAI